MAPANRLLIVDDGPGVARVIEPVAQKQSFAVRAIYDSEQFEKALGPLNPTVTVLDMSRSAMGWN